MQLLKPCQKVQGLQHFVVLFNGSNHVGLISKVIQNFVGKRVQGDELVVQMGVNNIMLGMVFGIWVSLNEN